MTILIKTVKQETTWENFSWEFDIISYGSQKVLRTVYYISQTAPESENEPRNKREYGEREIKTL